MGLFGQKQTSRDEEWADEQHFLDETFREELRNHARLYFDQVIKENGKLFKKDLDNTVSQIKVDLQEHISDKLDQAVTQATTDIKDHIAKQLEGQLDEYKRSMKAAQDVALQTVINSAQSVQEQHLQLGKTLQQTVIDQKEMFTTTYEENKAQVAEMKQVQTEALEALKQSADTLKKQYDELGSTLEKSVADQKDILVATFKDNMAQVVEHYLLGALGEQYDVKAQLPAIIQQMESNKQAIVDDISL